VAEVIKKWQEKIMAPNSNTTNYHQKNEKKRKENTHI
jgi:hypothetical protein